MTTSTDFCTTVFCTFAKNFDSFQSNLLYKKFNKTSRASSEKAKKAERLAKRRERNDNVCSRRLLSEEREACLGKRKEAWKKKTAEAKGKQRLVFTTLCTNDTVAIQVEV